MHFGFRHKAQWCGDLSSERVTRQAPYGKLSFGSVRLNIVEEQEEYLLLILSVRILALVIRHAMSMRHVVLLLSVIFLHIVS